MSMLETMETMHALLRGELSPEQAAASLGAPVERVAIYQDFVRDHVRTLLEKNYQVTAEVMGSGAWEALVRRFFETRPARHYELNANAEALVELIDECIARGSDEIVPFHRDLATLEWTEWLVYADRAEMPEPSRLDRAVLNPTLVILSLAWPVSGFVQAWRAAKDAATRPPLPSAPDPEQVFVYRDRGLARFVRADPGLLFAFKIAHDGLTVAQAADLSGLDPVTVAAVVRQASEAGVVILPV